MEENDFDDDVSLSQNQFDDEFEENEIDHDEEKEERDEEEKRDMDIIIDENKGANIGSQSKERISTRFLTKYEKARILGARALQISKNAPILVEIDPQMWDPLKIAEKELIERKIPFIIRRYLPNGSYEDWKVDELIID